MENWSVGFEAPGSATLSSAHALAGALLTASLNVILKAQAEESVTPRYRCFALLRVCEELWGGVKPHPTTCIGALSMTSNVFLLLDRVQIVPAVRLHKLHP